MTHKVRVFPHNDLFNLAHYHRERINQKLADGIEDALALDCMSCLISLAFSVEALINLIGHKRVRQWQEKDAYMAKMKKICTVAGINFRKCVEPYKSVWELKELRDSMAHGKPFESSTTAKTREELTKQMECPWDHRLTPKYVNHVYEQVKSFEHDLFSKCKISVGETLTSAVGLPV